MTNFYLFYAMHKYYKYRIDLGTFKRGKKCKVFENCIQITGIKRGGGEGVHEYVRNVLNHAVNAPNPS